MQKKIEILGGIKIKSKKETEKERAHKEVYVGGKYIGYFMPNVSKCASTGENWNFVPKCSGIQYFHSRTKKELLETLIKQLNRERVVIKQHFGTVVELN